MRSLLFSRPPAAPPSPPPSDPRSTDTPPPAASPPEPLPPAVAAPGTQAPLDIVTVLACGDAHVAPLLALALAALPSPLPRTTVLGAPGSTGWPIPLDAAASGLAELERSGGRALVVLPARDGCELRALAVAGARFVVWTPADGADAELDAVLDALHFGCAFAQLGWIGADDAAAGRQRARIERWSAAGADRRAAALGTWRPGTPLPPAVCGFLGTPVQGARPIGLAVELLGQRPTASR